MQTKELSAPKSQRFLRFAIAMPIADPRNRERFPRQETAMAQCDLRVRWKVASDLRFGLRFLSPKPLSCCGISGELAPSTRKSLAIAIVRFWCAKLRSLPAIYRALYQAQGWRETLSSGGKHCPLWGVGASWSLAISETLHCDLRVRWKVASDLRFRVAISEPENPSFRRISGDLALLTRKSLAIAIVRFWCAKSPNH